MNNLFLLLQVNLQTPVGDTIATPGAQEIKMSYWDLALKGGWIMIPIAILSVLAVYIFVERFFAIRKASMIDANFMNRVKDYIYDGKIDSALSLCQASDMPLARMIEKGIQRIGRPLNDIHAAIENVGRLEVSKLEKGLPALASAAGGAPMLGFLGTVTGMIRAFYNMSMAGNNLDIQLLSSGIYEAMVTTVAGLIVGIMGYFGYNILVASVEKLVNRLEAQTTEFMDLLNEPVKH
jgi:biopolymer transport protein ExbB